MEKPQGRPMTGHRWGWLWMHRSDSKTKLRELGSIRKAVVIDVETTGLSPWRDEVVELALVLFSFNLAGQIFPHSVEEYVGFREPSKPIPAAATRIHGLTMDDVAGQRLDHRRIASMMKAADFFVAHNASFDRPFVQQLFPNLARGKMWLCTMRDVNWSERGVASARLGHIAKHYGIPHANAHRALDDARVTLALLTLPGHDGAWTLTEMLARRVPGAKSRGSVF